LKQPAGADFSARVVRWQKQHGRHGLPWQGSRDPYRVWLSEVMLQQTQVVTVLVYYERFLAKFPDVKALAHAPLSQVLALWAGLGYYSRARNLHRCAQAVVQQHGGHFPDNAETLAELPGIGRSTAAAMAAFCFGERAAILDGNVKRVLTRHLGFAGDMSQAAAQRELWLHAENLLPLRGVDSYSQGLMDLGATLCLIKNPACERCPVAADCVARQEGQPQAYPVKTRRLKRSQREHWLLWLQQRGRWWLVERPDKGVWAGLWALPEFESMQTLERACAQLLLGPEAVPGAQGPRGIGAKAARANVSNANTAPPLTLTVLPTIEHALTHFDWTLHPVQAPLPARAALAAALTRQFPSGRWFTPAEALAVGLPAPLKRLLERAIEQQV
jgi:A/G-specific adenine glycosylase